jgi:hypothetical protein
MDLSTPVVQTENNIGNALSNMGYGIAYILSAILVLILAIVLIMLVIFFPSLSLTKAYDVCKLVPTSITGGSFNVAPSYWMAHIFFFFGYLITNAITLYKTDPYPGAADDKVRNRRNQSRTVIIVSILILLILVYLRTKTGCETGLGILISTIMIPLGVGWYYFGSISGDNKADIFGIISQILVPAAGESTAQVCVNTGT